MQISSDSKINIEAMTHLISLCSGRFHAASRWLTIFSRYGLAGLLGTSAHYAVMWFLLAQTPPVVASTFGAICGCLLNYFFSRTFVFRTDLPIRPTLVRFSTVGLICIAANGIVLTLIGSLMSLPLAQLIATGIVLILGFSLNKYWTFHA
ncbi:MAG: GtrA family protein [Pseudomonadota bacterium]